ncbi:MAG TPA: site-specific integrase [Puia sp.]|nr:site-specific integrase [Puia sp.]
MKIKPFSFLKNYSDQNSDQILGNFVNWKPPKLYKGKRWWIEYQFRIPEELWPRYKGARWKGFPVFEDINRYKTDEYAELLLKAVRFALEQGFNPFEYEKKAFLEFQQTMAKDPDKVWTYIEASNYFIQEWEQRGLEPATLTKLRRAIEVLTAYLTKANLQHGPVKNITRDHIKAALRQASEEFAWSNRTFNNNKTALSTLFTFLQKEEDPLTYFATRLIYYLCIRAEKELKHFRVGNIFLDRKQVLIQAEEAKTDADRYIPIPDELTEDLTNIRTRYPENYYVVGKGDRIKFVRENTPSATPFPNNMISARFAKIRKKAGLSSDHTPYSFKHTRVIHLKQDGARDSDIMQVTGHTSFQAYAEYLRDLGAKHSSKLQITKYKTLITNTKILTKPRVEFDLLRGTKLSSHENMTAISYEVVFLFIALGDH